MLPLRRIVCACDFSEFSARALALGAALAARYQAELQAIHVLHQLPVSDLPVAAGAGFVAPLPKEEVREALERFVAAQLPGAMPVELAVLDGAPAWRIVAHAEQAKADLLVLGTHGRSGFERFVLGSVAEKVLRRAPCPVLTVSRRAVAVPPAGEAPFARVLCPVDFSAASVRALEYGIDLAGDQLSELLLVHVVEIPPAVSPGRRREPAAVRQDMDGEIGDMLDALVPAPVRGRARSEVIAGETRAYREVLRLARERDVDLVAMGVTGRTAFDRMLFGSNVTQVVRAAECPVLTVRA